MVKIPCMCMPSEPHGEGRYRGELWKKLELGENDAVWRLSTRRHSPLHNNEPELIDYFTSPLGIRESICSAGVEFKRGRPSSSHLRKQMPFALHVAANEYRIARRCPPASFPAKRQFFRMFQMRRSDGLLLPLDDRDVCSVLKEFQVIPARLF